MNTPTRSGAANLRRRNVRVAIDFTSWPRPDDRAVADGEHAGAGALRLCGGGLVVDGRDVGRALAARDDDGEATVARVRELVGGGDADEVDAAVARGVAVGAEAERSDGVGRLLAAGGRDVVFVAVDGERGGDVVAAVVDGAVGQADVDELRVRRPDRRDRGRGGDRRRLCVGDVDV